MTQCEHSAERVMVTRPTSYVGRVVRVCGYVLGVTGCLAFMTVGTGVGIFYRGSTVVREILARHGLSMFINTFTHVDMLHEWTPPKQFPGRSTLNVLVLGVDHDYDNRAQIVRSTPGRSDAILVAHVDFDARTIQALTIPRDTAVRIPGRRGFRKINAAHSYGGAPLTMETIRAVFGIAPDCSVSVNLEGFQRIVDAVGGVDVTVRKRLKYDDNWGNLHIDLQPGFQHLNGYQAMGYVRMRHSDSDRMRSARQHEFLEALRQRVKSPRVFLDLPAVIDRASEAVTLVGLTRDQLYALGNFARTLPRDAITLETLPSVEGRSFVAVDKDKSEPVIRRIFFGNQQVALNIDAASPSAVADLNSPYERGARHARRHRKRNRYRDRATDQPQTTSPTPDDARDVEGSGDAGAPDPGGSGSDGNAPPDGA